VSGWHGVTSVAIGNCGFGFAPCRVEDQDRAMLALTRNEAIPYKSMKAGMLWDWITFPEFLDSLDRIPKGVNVLSYVPLSPVYAWVMGYEEAKSRRPSEAELKEMCRLVSEGMDAGGCGWSAQVLGPRSVQRDYYGTPMITDLMSDEELLAFAQVLRDRDEGFIELSYRGTGDEARMLEDHTMSFFEQVAEVSNRPVIYQAIAAVVSNPDQHRQRLRWLEECAKKNLRVIGQAQLRRSGLELTFEDWNMFDESPSWREVTLGSLEERKLKMEDPELRAKLREEWDSGILPETMFEGSVAGLMVEEVRRTDYEDYIGMSVGEIAEKEGKHVIDALLDIVVGDNLQTEFFADAGRDSAGYGELAAEIANSPYTIAGVSDGGAHVKFTPGGTYPTDILTLLVRDEGRVSLEEAHYKLSYLPAFIGGFKDRGFLREGAPADVVVYDLEKLSMGTTEVAHDLPGNEWRRIQRPTGYRWIMVNGEVTLEDGEPTGILSGKLLRHGAG